MTDTEKGMILGIAMQQPFIIGNSVNLNKPVIINDGLKLGIKASCSVNGDQETQSLRVGVYMSATCTIEDNA